MEELLNKKVKHIKFGVGTIIGIVDNNKIIVEFDEEAENKKFQYPEVFESFLKFHNSSLQEDIIKKLEEKNEQDIIEKEKIALEYKKQYEKRKKEERKLTKKKRKLVN